MKPSDRLRAEHRVIEKVLNCLESFILRFEITKQFDLNDARLMLDFFRDYADAWHHAKEEEALFPLMELKGFPRDVGPTGVMLREHIQGRAYNKMMRAVLDSQPATDAEKSNFMFPAREYIHMLREHIRKEDECLFDMADQRLTEADQKQLSDEFDETEKRFSESGAKEKAAVIVDTLAKKYLD